MSITETTQRSDNVSEPSRNRDLVDRAVHEIEGAGIADHPNAQYVLKKVRPAAKSISVQMASYQNADRCPGSGKVPSRTQQLGSKDFAWEVSDCPVCVRTLCALTKPRGH